MPAYEYKCPKGHLNEKVFSMKSFPMKVECWCGKTAEKIISRFHFGNSPEFNKRYHPEECNAHKDVDHWQKKHGKGFYDDLP